MVAKGEGWVKLKPLPIKCWIGFQEMLRSNVVFSCHKKKKGTLDVQHIS